MESWTALVLLCDTVLVLSDRLASLGALKNSLTVILPFLWSWSCPEDLSLLLDKLTWLVSLFEDWTSLALVCDAASFSRDRLPSLAPFWSDKRKLSLLLLLPGDISVSTSALFSLVSLLAILSLLTSLVSLCVTESASPAKLVLLGALCSAESISTAPASSLPCASVSSFTSGFSTSPFVTKATSLLLSTELLEIYRGIWSSVTLLWDELCVGTSSPLGRCWTGLVLLFSGLDTSFVVIALSSTLPSPGVRSTLSSCVSEPILFWVSTWEFGRWPLASEGVVSSPRFCLDDVSNRTKKMKDTKDETFVALWPLINFSIILKLTGHTKRRLISRIQIF